MSIYIYIYFLFVKLLFDKKNNSIIMRTEKIIKKIIFALFLLQKVKLKKL